MKKTLTRDLTVGSPMRLVISFTIPLLLGFAFQQLYSFVDTAIVGRTLGSRYLAAVGATNSINFLILGLCNGLCAGMSVPIAQAFGAKEEGELRRYVANAAWVCAVFGVVLAAVTALLCRGILDLLNTDHDIIDFSVSYIRIIFIGIPATMMYNMCGGILRSLGDSRTPVIFLAMASLVNIALDFLLIPVMGVGGAALATVISQILSAIGCLIVMKKRFAILQLSRDEWRPRPAVCRHLVGIGIPMGLQYSITAIGAILLTWSVNSLEDAVNAVAAMTTAGKLSMFFACIFDALATTMATFSGQNIGARKVDRVNQGLLAASIVGCVYCVIAELVIIFFGHDLLGLFLDLEKEDTVARMAHQFLIVNGSMYIPLLFVNIVRLSIQGMGYTGVAMLAGVAEMIARGLVALFVVPALGFDGVCFANPTAWIFADLFLFPCYFSIIKRLRVRLGCPKVRKSIA